MLRDPGGFSGLDVPWRRQTERDWEAVLEQPAPATINVTHHLLEELGGAEHVAKYGWEVDVTGAHVVLTKTSITVMRTRLADLLDRFTERLTLGMVAVYLFLRAVWRDVTHKED